MSLRKIKENTIPILFTIVSLVLLVILFFNTDNINPTSSFFIFLVSSLNVLLSFRFLKKGLSFDFEFLFSILLFLGIFVKLVVHSAFHYKWAEPIGGFVESVDSLSQIVNVTSVGLLGVTLAILVNRFFYHQTHREDILHIPKISSRAPLIISFAGLIFLFINLKFNILTLGLIPSIKLPFKGNIIFFLTYTRYLFYFLFLFWFRSVSLGNLCIVFFVAVLASVGTLSRMIPVIVFAGLLLHLIKSGRLFTVMEKKKRFFRLILTFGVASMMTIFVSNSLRSFFYAKKEARAVVAQEDSVKFDYVAEKDIKHKLFEPGLKRHDLNAPFYLVPLIQLGVDRWIGLEGLMAVEGFPGKGFSFLKKALSEPSYNGRSLFSLISHSRKKGEASRESNKISTSVPGPMAFFYYSGSRFFMMLMMFISVILCRGIVELFSMLKAPTVSLSYLASVMVFDFFQFGISPSSFLKNWAFSFTLFVALLLVGRKFCVNKGISSRS
jgi:hypothetical protein